MSTAIAFKGIDCVVMASDSILTSKIGLDIVLYDNMRTKIFELSNKSAVSFVANNSGFFQFMVDRYIDRVRQNNVEYVDDVVDDFTTSINKGYLDYAEAYSKGKKKMKTATPPFSAEFVLGGLSKANKAQIYCVTLDRDSMYFVKKKEDYFRIAGQSFIADYWMTKLFHFFWDKKGRQIVCKVSEDVLGRFIALLIHETSKIYREVGPPIDMLVIHKDTGLRWVDTAGISRYIIDVMDDKKMAEQLIYGW